MSLYGNVRRIGAQAFQFDRIYPNRVAMLDAMQKQEDGVHVGRYALIEYGERYEILNDQTITRHEFDPETKLVVEKTYPKWQERETFTLNRNIDQEHFGANYDSTVWQKIYRDGELQYIMVAELNAILPKLDIDIEGGMIYSAVKEGEVPDEVYDAFNNKVDNIKVSLNKPYFDQYQDTEMAYLLHYPSPIQLNVDSQSIDFNQQGFNIFYSTQKDSSASYIHWLTDDFYGQNYDVNKKPLPSSDGATYRKTNLSALMTSKTLRMHMPVFGNTIADLYDLLYGHPAYERDENNKIIYNETIDEQGNRVLDPQIAYYRYPGTNILYDTHGHLLIKINENGIDKFMIVNESGNPIDENGQEITKDQNGNYTQTPRFCEQPELVLETIRPYFKQYRDKYPTLYALDDNNEFQPTTTIRTPLNDAEDNYYWSKDVPYISDILTNNSAGLAAILGDLFGIKNPLTGEIKYWLLNDWTAEEYNEDGNNPTIRNKPEVVTYLTETTYQDLSGLFTKHGEDGKQYAIQRQKWLTGAKVKPSDKIPIYGADGKPIIDIATNEQAIASLDYSENYQYYNVRKNNSGNTLEEGHWYVDFNSWALRRISNLPADLGFNITVKKLDANRYHEMLNDETAPDYLKDICRGIIANSDPCSVEVSQTGLRKYTITIKCEDVDSLYKFKLKRTETDEDKKPYLGFDLETNESDIMTLSRNEVMIGSGDVQDRADLFLSDKSILQWINLEELKNNTTMQIRIKNKYDETCTLKFVWIQTTAEP